MEEKESGIAGILFVNVDFSEMRYTWEEEDEKGNWPIPAYQHCYSLL